MHEQLVELRHYALPPRVVGTQRVVRGRGWQRVIATGEHAAHHQRRADRQEQGSQQAEERKLPPQEAARQQQALHAELGRGQEKGHYEGGPRAAAAQSVRHRQDTARADGQGRADQRPAQRLAERAPGLQERERDAMAQRLHPSSQHQPEQQRRRGLEAQVQQGVAHAHGHLVVHLAAVLAVRVAALRYERHTSDDGEHVHDARGTRPRAWGSVVVRDHVDQEARRERSDVRGQRHGRRLAHRPGHGHAEDARETEREALEERDRAAPHRHEGLHQQRHHRHGVGGDGEEHLEVQVLGVRAAREGADGDTVTDLVQHHGHQAQPEAGLRACALLRVRLVVVARVAVICCVSVSVAMVVLVAEQQAGQDDTRREDHHHREPRFGESLGQQLAEHHGDRRNERKASQPPCQSTMTAEETQGGAEQRGQECEGIGERHGPVRRSGRGVCAAAAWCATCPIVYCVYQIFAVISVV